MEASFRYPASSGSEQVRGGALGEAISRFAFQGLVCREELRAVGVACTCAETAAPLALPPRGAIRRELRWRGPS
eukprot:5199273-Pyramimonas_sp.AAC.1